MAHISPPPGPERERVDAWIGATQEFQRKAAPIAFTWVGWCLILAAIRYAEERTGEWALTAIWGILIFLLWGHFVSVFGEKTMKWRTAAEMRSAQNLLSWGLSIVATAGMVLSSIWLSNVLLRHPL